MKPRELTLRGLILGALITTVFTAANIYLGLKVGLTFASSIPAAVISMAILSAVKDSSILENNIVQTVASAAGTLSAIIFVLPGLVIVGWWTEFPFWQSFLICLSGGLSLVRSPHSLGAKSAARRTPWYSRGVGIDCRRKHMGCDQCGIDRRAVEGSTALAGSRKFCSRSVARSSRLRRRDWVVVRLDAAEICRK